MEEWIIFFNKMETVHPATWWVVPADDANKKLIKQQRLHCKLTYFINTLNTTTT
jgi:hypothetical protein